MATRNIVPRATGEGSIGTSAKTWGAGYFNDIAVTNDVTASMFMGDLTGDVTGNADTATNATNATNDALGNNIASTYLPAVVGAVVAYAGSTSPDGWLLCDGSAVSRTDYADLYAVIGDTYGDGDGSTTFNLPDLSNGAITKEFSDPNNVLKNSSVVERNGRFKFTDNGTSFMDIAINSSGAEEYPAYFGYRSDGSVNNRLSYGSGLKINMSDTFNTLKQSYQVSMRYIIKY